jgi:thiamine-phosphate pyrophosphorylase
MDRRPKPEVRSPLDLPVLHAILDVETAASHGWSPLDLASAFLDGGATFIQIRAKGMASGPLLDLSDAVVRLARPAGATVIVNDRVDVALMSGAAGAHVGQDDLPPGDARRLLGDGAIVGYSTHSPDQIRGAIAEPLTYLAVGPVFSSRTKDTGYEAVGLELVRTAVSLGGGRPVVAIGGITLETAPAVLEAGATMVAVIGDLLRDGRPADQVGSYNRLASVRRV